MGANVHLGDAVEILPPVVLGNDSRVGDHAIVGPFCMAAAGVQIGKGARVSESVLLDGAKVEASDRLERMIVGKKASLSADTTPPREK